MPSHFLIEALLGLGPVALFLAALIYLDSFKLVGVFGVLAVMLLGVLAATLSYGASGFIMDSAHIGFRDYSRYGAPFLEEGLKAAMMIWLFRTNRIGFMIDAAIMGATIGAGFAVAENAYYAYTFPDANLSTWVIRGLGTAVMHSGTTAIFGIAAQAFQEKQEKIGLIGALPGFLFAVSIHMIYNQFTVFPFVSTAGIIIALPFSLMFVFDKSEHEVHTWLIHDYETHEHLLADIASGKFAHTEAGQLILSLAKRFSKEVVADIFAYLKLHTELVLHADQLLLARERGETAKVDGADAGKFARLHALERKIGQTTLMTLWPHLKFSRQELFELHVLEHEAAHAKAA